MKKLIILLAVFNFLYCNAQELSYKKEVFKYDKTTVAKVEDKRYMLMYKNFTVVNNAGDEIITFKVESGGGLSFYSADPWYEVKFLGVDKPATIKIPMTLFGSAAKEIMPVIATLGIIKPDGAINAEGVDKYLKINNFDFKADAKRCLDSVTDMVNRGGTFYALKKGNVKVGFNKSITVDGKNVGVWQKFGDAKSADGQIWVFNNTGGLEFVFKKSSDASGQKKLDVYTWHSAENIQWGNGSSYGVSYGSSDTDIIATILRSMINYN